MPRVPPQRLRSRGTAGEGGTGTPREPPRATLTFRGTRALLRLSRPEPLAQVRYDGVALPQDRWRAAEAGSVVEVTCPPTAFDADQHTLRLDWTAPGMPALALAFRSEYDAALEVADDARIAGWIIDALRPDTPITLNVRCGERLLQTRNTLPRGEAAGGGFALDLPPRVDTAEPEWLTVTVDGTVHQPFGPVLRGATLPAALSAGAAAARALGPTPAGRLFGAVLLPALAVAIGNERLPGALPLRGPQVLTRPVPPDLDVIVPVYRGEAETLACLASLFDGGNLICHRVVVIDDCSPEPALSAALDALAERGRIHLLRNETNLGFVASVNRGMALSATADVLLLNADTQLPPGALDRLYRAAHGDELIATVTPLSNNATAYSLPAPPGDPADPWGLPYDAIDAICQTVNAGVVRDIPTAHGFCMYVTRAALDDVGLFDAETFGTGYGEENDFSLRAMLRGWRNVCAADVYVRHVAAVSFAATPERDAQLAANLHRLGARYPFYHDLIAGFLRADPLHDLRNAVQKSVWRRHERIAVFVTLALQGGAARHAGDLMARLAGEGWLPLALTAETDDGGEARVTVRRAGSDEALRYPPAAPLEAALADILDLAPRFLHVQHLIDLPDGVAQFVRDCGIPYAVTLHDFFYACPKVTLLDAGTRYCGMPPAAKCTVCVRQGPVHAQLHPSLLPLAEAGETWRGHWEALLREAAQVIAPSHDTAERYASLFPGLTPSVRPHFAPADLALPPGAARPATGTRLRVALPGALGPQKGVHALIDLARHCSRWHDDIEFVVVGYTDREEELRRYDNIAVRGGYKPAEAVTALIAAECRVALLLNVFPETFSYALSEALQAGLVPVAYDFGAIGERLRTLGVGVLVPPGASPEQHVAAIRAAACQTAEVPAALLYGQYGSLLRDYYAPALTDLIDVAPAPDLPRLLSAPRGWHADGWCEGSVSLAVWSARPPQRLAFDFWVPDEARFQAVTIACNGERLARHSLEPGGGRRIVLALPQDGRRPLAITCRFDFVLRPRAPDVRACAAILSAVQVSEGEGKGWLTLERPGAAPRAQRPAEAAD